MGEDFFLVPKTPHTIEVRFDITEDQASLVSEDMLALNVEGKITHPGALNRPRSPYLDGYVLCGNGKARFESEMRMRPVPESPYLVDGKRQYGETMNDS